ncbi:MAG: N(G),N(G)-dimethylarginine dimethylaminohydrolase [Spirochaetes bacterium]|nr:N(G),N(G)-dimethylarginine dimethylaminohydrolase [Spirochaetota bacterium]MBU1080323.1 N(G),N(G)-dimethylarginine dimethylaminohydrolase [Spirochaetota bacterium]
MNTFKHAIVRKPAKSLVDGITTHPELGKPDYELALRQHEAYVGALERCGLSVRVLPAQEEFPDSCFVEDVAVCTGRFALVTRPGADTRRGEIAGVRELLAEYYDDLEEIRAPGTIEGGDVMMVGEAFYIGLSSRTNADGAAQFIAALERRGYSGRGVKMPPTLHLKTGCSYMEEGVLLVDRAFAAYPEFASFKRVDIAPEESYAANCLRVNDYVIVPAGYPKALAAIRAAGMRTIELDMSEYRKIDGGLSCLSLRF